MGQIITNSWEIKELADIAEIIMGHSPAGTSYNRSGIGIPLINGPTEFTDKYPKKIQWTTQPTVFSKKGDILLCVRGSSTGRINISDDTYCIGRGIAAIRSKKNSDTEFIKYILIDAIQSIVALATGSTFPNIDRKSLSSISFNCPPLDEQRRIAEALSDADAQIMALAELIAKKRDIKHGTMQRLLTGQERLAGFSGEWEVKQLRQLCNAIIDGTHYTPTYVANGIPFYSVENVVANDFINTKFISQEEHLILTRKYKPQKGDILLTRIGSLGVTKLIDWDIEASIYVSLALLRLNESVSSTYLYSYTKSKQFIKDIESHSLMNATPKKINMGEIGNIPIPIPPLDEQIAIARVLSDMDADIEALQTEHDKWVMIKQGMMHELLTGKVRL